MNLSISWVWWMHLTKVDFWYLISFQDYVEAGTEGEVKCHPNQHFCQFCNNISESLPEVHFHIFLFQLEAIFPALHSASPELPSLVLIWIFTFQSKKRIRLGEEPSARERKPWRNGRLGKVDLKKWKRLKNAAERWKVCWTWVSNWVELMPISDAG